MRTNLLVGCLLSALLALASGCAGEPESPSIVIGYQSIPNGEMVVKQLKWHEQTLGADVQWVQFNSGTELNAAMAAGSVDVGLGGSSTTAVAIAQGVPARVIWIHDIIADNEALVVRDDDTVRNLGDLRGKTVAAPFGATTHYHLLTALRLAGIDPGEVRILDMPPTEMLAAWLRGDIDAGFVWEPTLAAMLQAGGRVLISSGALAREGYLTGDIGIVRNGFAQRHPEIVTAYLRNQIRAVELIRSDPATAAGAIAAELELSPEEALRQMNSLIFLNGTEQLSAAYLGTSETPGEIAEVFLQTSRFLKEQETIAEVPGMERVKALIAPEYLEAAVE